MKNPPPRYRIVHQTYAALVRIASAGKGDISIGMVREEMPAEYREHVSDLTIQSELHEAGFRAIGAGIYRRTPKVKPPRPRYRP